VEAAPKKGGQVGETSRAFQLGYPEVFRVFSQLQSKRQGIIQKGHGLPTPVMEAFRQNDSSLVAEAISQSDPNPFVFNSQTYIHPSNQSSFRKGQVT
jgi:hypothetical protein